MPGLLLLLEMLRYQHKLFRIYQCKVSLKELSYKNHQLLYYQFQKYNLLSRLEISLRKEFTYKSIIFLLKVLHFT